MKNIKSLLYAAAAVLLLPLTSCSDDDYPQVPAPAGQEVYFSDTLATSYTLTRDASKVEIPLMRVKTEEAETVQLIFEDESGLFTIPSSVTFAAGANSSNIAIAYDFAALEPASEYKISLLVMGNQSEWGQSQVELKMVVPEPWIKLGTGLYRDDIVPSLFNGIEPREHEVEIYEYDGRKGYYYIASPYDAVFISEWFDADPSELVNNVQEVKFIIDATDPNAVVIASQSNPQPLGCILGQDGWLYTFSVDPGTLVDGVITFPENGLVAMFSELDGGYSANSHGLFRVVLPGVELLDYAISAAYDGMKISADGATASALFNLSFGEDVASYKYVVAEGDVTETLDTVAAGIVDGSLENVVDGNIDNTSIAIALENSGLYSFVAVPYNDEGEAQTADAVIVVFYFPGAGGGSVPEIECSLKADTVATLLENEAAEAQFPSTTCLGWDVVATDVKELTYFLGTTVSVNGVGLTYQEILDQYGKKTSGNKNSSGYSIVDYLNQDGEYIGVFTGLNADVEYTLLVEIESIYGKKYLLSDTHKTSAYPYTGELVLGEYTITDEEYESSSTFTLSHTADPNTFIVKDLLLSNATQFYAAYDSSAATLTLNGVEQGYEDDGNVFGGLYAWFNKDRDWVYGYFSFANLEDNNADNPVVFGIDAATKQIKSLNTYLFISIYTNSTKEFVGNAYIFTPSSVITKSEETATSAVKKTGLLADSRISSLRNCKMMDCNLSNHSLNVERASRTLPVKAEPCAREKKSAFTISDRAKRSF